MLFNHLTNSLIHQFANSLCSLCSLWLKTVSIRVNLCNLWLRVNQSKQLNYAKQTQFTKKSNVYNRNFNNQL
jgi:hypothetical protein